MLKQPNVAVPISTGTKSTLLMLTNAIKSEESEISNRFILIGQYLTRIKNEELHKVMYTSWEEYIENNFSFTVRTADRIIQIVNDKDLMQRQELGISRLIELLSIEPEKRDEILDTEVDPEELDDDALSNMLLDHLAEDDDENTFEKEYLAEPVPEQNGQVFLPPIKIKDLPVSQFKQAIRKQIKSSEDKVKTPEELLAETQTDLLKHLSKFEAIIIQRKEDINLLGVMQKEELAKTIKRCISHLTDIQRMIVKGIS